MVILKSGLPHDTKIIVFVLKEFSHFFLNDVVMQGVKITRKGKGDIRKKYVPFTFTGEKKEIR